VADLLEDNLLLAMKPCETWYEYNCMKKGLSIISNKNFKCARSCVEQRYREELVAREHKIKAC
jgi:hypothetical protein